MTNTRPERFSDDLLEDIRLRTDLVAYATEMLGGYPESAGGGNIKIAGAGLGGLFILKGDGSRPDVWNWRALELGGGPIELASYLRHGILTPKGKQFIEIVHELAAFAGIDGDWTRDERVTLPSFVRREPPVEVTGWEYICSYEYYNATGRIVYYVDRYERRERFAWMAEDAPVTDWARNKTFTQRPFGVERSFHDDGTPRGGRMDNVDLVPYELPSVLSAVRRDATIWWCEGEKDCDTFNLYARHEFGWEDVATTGVGGAGGQWQDSYSEALRGARVVVWADDDIPGKRYAERVVRALEGIAASVTTVDRDTLKAMIEAGGAA